MTGRTSLRWGSATDAGLVRRTNQDHLVVDPGLFAVADGMGGHAAGEVAVRARRSTRSATAFARDRRRRVPATTSSAAVRTANATVFEHANADAELRGMGTTLTAAAVVTVDGEERIAVANVGDSRAYVFAHGDLTQLTEDHSVAEELARIGEIGPEEVETHPQRHILTRALGIFPEIEVDLWDVLPYPGDRVLLCSDGLVREMTDEQIAVRPAPLRRSRRSRRGAGRPGPVGRRRGQHHRRGRRRGRRRRRRRPAPARLGSARLPAVPAAPDATAERGRNRRQATGRRRARRRSGSAPSASARPRPQTTPRPRRPAPAPHGSGDRVRGPAASPSSPARRSRWWPTPATPTSSRSGPAGSARRLAAGGARQPAPGDRQGPARRAAVVPSHAGRDDAAC